jgi:hypothetical protein
MNLLSPSTSPSQPLKINDNKLSRVELYHDPNEMINLVADTKKALENYVNYVFIHDLESNIREDRLISIQTNLDLFSNEMEKYNFATEDREKLFQEITECREYLNALLVDHTSSKGLLASTVGLIAESTAPQEIKWKIKKYETLILSISKAVESIRGEAANNVAFALRLPPEYEEMLKTNNATRFTLENLDIIRQKYSTDFMTMLRRQLKKHPKDPGVLEICYHLYCNISLEKENKHVLDLFSKWGEKCLKDQLVPSPFTHAEVIEFDYLDQKIRAVPNSAKAPLTSIWGNSLRGVFNRAFDPGVQGNPIHCLYMLKIGEKEIKSLGFGSPTTEGLTIINSAELTPEFIGFITACKVKKQKHLFIINQDITSNGYLCAEKQRCDLVMYLQSEEEFKDTFFAVAFSKNSSFYYQDGKNYQNTKQFIDDLIMQFEQPHTGTFIPPQIMKEAKIDLRQIAAAIHCELFKKEYYLSKKERLLFIEIFYDLLTLWLIINLEVGSFNISCKDAVDRGAAANAQLYSHLAIINDGFTEEHKTRTMVLMMVRALLVRKRSPIRSRLLRLLESLDFYLGHPNELKKLHQRLFGTTTFLPRGFVN